MGWARVDGHRAVLSAFFFLPARGLGHCHASIISQAGTRGPTEARCPPSCPPPRLSVRAHSLLYGDPASHHPSLRRRLLLLCWCFFASICASDHWGRLFSCVAAHTWCCFIVSVWVVLLLLFLIASCCITYRLVLLCIISVHFCYFIPLLATSPPPPAPRPLALHHPQQLGPSPVQNCAANKGASAAPHPLLSSLPLSPTPIPPPPPKKQKLGKKKYIHGRGSDLCPCPAAHLVQAVRAAGRCDAVFRGFSDCLLRLGDNMANYPQDLDDKRNLQTICA